MSNKNNYCVEDLVNLFNQMNLKKFNKNVLLDFYLKHNLKSVYKYCYDSIYSLASLQSNQLWFSHPSKFNDDFEFNIFWKQNVINQLLNNNKEFYLIKKLESMYKERCKSYLDKCLVSCFCEDPCLLNMWGVYANLNRGFCLEYDPIILLQEKNIAILPVIYSNSRYDFFKSTFPFLYEIPLDIHRNTSFYIQMLIYLIKNIKYFMKIPINNVINFLVDTIYVKGLDWKGEKEWRAIYMADNIKRFNDGCLVDIIKPVSITLGTKMEVQFRNLLLTYCKANDIKVYELQKKDDTRSFKRTIVKI